MGSSTLTRLSASRSSLVFRFALVFVLGILSPLLFSPFDLAPWWAQPLALLLLLLVVVGVSGIQAPQRGLGSLMAPLILAGLGGLYLWLRALVAAAGPAATATIEARQAAAQWGILAALLMPILVGAAAALVAQREPSWLHALVGAEVVWLGAALSNVGVTWLGPTINPTVQAPELSTNVIIIAVASVLGFLVALGGGLLGWGLPPVEHALSAPKHTADPEIAISDLIGHVERQARQILHASSLGENTERESPHRFGLAPTPPDLKLIKGLC